MQESASSQFRGVPGKHAPPEQVSPTVQALPSLHEAVLFTGTHAPVPSHKSSVQTFTSTVQGVSAGRGFAWQCPRPSQLLGSSQAELEESPHKVVVGDGVLWSQPPGVHASIVHGS